jgi:hypothetical protein
MAAVRQDGNTSRTALQAELVSTLASASSILTAYEQVGVKTKSVLEAGLAAAPPQQVLASERPATHAGQAEVEAAEALEKHKEEQEARRAGSERRREERGTTRKEAAEGQKEREEEREHVLRDAEKEARGQEERIEKEKARRLREHTREEREKKRSDIDKWTARRRDKRAADKVKETEAEVSGGMLVQMDKRRRKMEEEKGEIEKWVKDQTHAWNWVQARRSEERERALSIGPVRRAEEIRRERQVGQERERLILLRTQLSLHTTYHTYLCLLRHTAFLSQLAHKPPIIHMPAEPSS